MVCRASTEVPKQRAHKNIMLITAPTTLVLLHPNVFYGLKKREYFITIWHTCCYNTEIRLGIIEYNDTFTFSSSSLELLCERAIDALDMKRLKKLYSVCHATTSNVRL